MNDIALLRQYEPVIHFTHGEKFYPCAVDEYIKRCSLWIRNDEGKEEQIIPSGELNVDVLGNFNTLPKKHTYYLRFVHEPLRPNAFRLWLQEPIRPVFKSAGRLSRVNLMSRLIDSLFDLSLVLRGVVPGGTAAKADYLYREMRQTDKRDVYYGRVIREGGYIILHYLFFYVMNDWRSGFYGVNDHEADWEQIFIFLSDEEENDPVPRWVAYASHDFTGDDLRRHWDDPELKKDGTHPSIFAGAGSHASYFSRGEYLMNIAPSFLKPIRQIIQWGQRFWFEQLGQGQQRITGQIQALIRIPFIDYARGDGVKIGPGQERLWTPIILTEAFGWAENYRGLWGLDTRDFVGGERAPGGAKFNRDGSVRQSWSDPLGWAGLDKVIPPRKTTILIKKHIDSILQKEIELKQLYEQLQDKTHVLALETVAFSDAGYQTPLLNKKQTELAVKQAELRSLKQELAELIETKSTLETYLSQVEAGDWGDKRAHISHTHEPEPPKSNHRWIVDAWAALSSGLLLIALIVLLSIPSWRSSWYVWIAIVIASFVFIEAVVQGRIVKLLLNMTIFLAIVTILILIWRFWLLVVIGALGFFVLNMLRENLRELRRL